eukprot:6650831-Pyramimonas_sp.AAC.1
MFGVLAFSASRHSKTAQKKLPRSPQEGPESAHAGPKTAQDGSKTARKAPKTARTSAKTKGPNRHFEPSAPKGPGGPKRPQRDSQKAPRVFLSFEPRWITDGALGHH